MSGHTNATQYGRCLAEAEGFNYNTLTMIGNSRRLIRFLYSRAYNPATH